MKMTNKTWLCCLFVLCCSCCRAQMSQYQFKRALPAMNEQWNKIILPDEIFGKLAPGFSDIRIFGVTASNDTITAPYLLREAAPKANNETIPAKIINQASTAKGFYFTFELGENKPVNQISLDFNQQNFDWRVQLEGSMDQQAWFTVLNNYRLLSIEKETNSYRFTSLVFPEAQYRFYRLFINSRQKPLLSKAMVTRQLVTDGITKKYTAVFNTSLDKETGHTVVSVEMPVAVPVSRIKVYVHDTVDYYRPVSFLYAADSFQSAAGWRYRYQTLASGTLGSLEKNVLTCETTVARKLQLVIANQDNRPLKIDSVAVEGFELSLLARITEPASWYLVYGNARATAPSYDLSHFTDKIPATAAAILPAAETGIQTPVQTAVQPLFQNKAWLWLMMVVIILVLGSFTISMMRKA